jgi:hypothetical protein
MSHTVLVLTDATMLFAMISMLQSSGGVNLCYRQSIAKGGCTALMKVLLR